jgi:hypothetical protein
MITLLLCERGVLRDPMLYLSLFFKTHRSVYYDLLDRLCEMGLVREITGRRRDRVFSYAEYIEILNEGTDLPEAGS